MIHSPLTFPHTTEKDPSLNLNLSSVHNAENTWFRSRVRHFRSTWSAQLEPVHISKSWSSRTNSVDKMLTFELSVHFALWFGSQFEKKTLLRKRGVRIQCVPREKRQICSPFPRHPKGGSGRDQGPLALGRSNYSQSPSFFTCQLF